MPDPSPTNADVRMRGFSRRTTVQDALRWLDDHAIQLGDETVPLGRAAGRVLAREVTSRVDVPGFDRAMMDGFALLAADTTGASPYNPIELRVIGESMPGRPFAGKVTAGRAVQIMTGSAMPQGADAVLPVELVEINGPQVRAQGDVSPGKHVGRLGEDVSSGTAVLPAGRVLRPQDVGVLASIGRGEVAVVARPRARIVVTGNELLPAGSMPGNDMIVDSNGPMLAALARRDGAIVSNPGIVPDEPEAVLQALRCTSPSETPPAMADCRSPSETPPAMADVVLVSGGSSVGREDHAPALLSEHGQLPIHGIAMRPSSPAGMGLLDGRLVFLLPGNPVSCLCAYDFFAGRAIRFLGGRSVDWPYRRITVPLLRKIVSTVGRLDYMRVRVVQGRAEPLAIGGASVLSSTTRADGFVLVPPDSEGYPPGSEVEVYLYD